MVSPGKKFSESTSQLRKKFVVVRHNNPRYLGDIGRTIMVHVDVRKQHETLSEK
jgi:hypothetical protein